MAKGKNGKGKGGKRRKTEDKADAVEVRTGELELKQIEIADDDFDMHFRSLKGAVEKMKTAKNLYDGCCKAAKKVSPELLDAVKYAIKLEGLDPADIKRELEVKGYALKRTGSTVQLTIHDSLLGDVSEAAEKRGYLDGKNGRSANCPYPEGTDLARRYFGGWTAGQTKLIGADDDGDDETIHADERTSGEPAVLQ